MKPRATLKSYFTRGAIPKESDFADLIDSVLIQDEDTVFKTANDPLSIKATGAEELLLNFYRAEQGNNTLTWQLKQKPAGAKPGLSIGDGAGAGLFIESGSGNVGIGTLTPGARLEVSGPGLAIKVTPTAESSVHIGRGAQNSLEFDLKYGTALNSTGYLAFNIDTDNGQGDTYIDFRRDAPGFTGGASLLRVLENGNVGIGTTTPAAKLDITASTTTWNGWYEAIRFSRPEHSAITHPGGGLLFGMHSDRRFYFLDAHSGQYIMTVKADTRRVGIGTSEPKYPLHIFGGVPAGVNFPGFGTYPGSSLPVCGLYIEGAGGGAAMGWHVFSDARIKRDPTPVEPLRSLATLAELTLYEYEYTPEYQPSSSGQKYHGFLAQEVEKVIPAAVSVVGDHTNSDGQVIEGLRVIAHDRIFGEAVGAIQALHAMLQRQESRIRELEGRDAVDRLPGGGAAAGSVTSEAQD